MVSDSANFSKKLASVEYIRSRADISDGFRITDLEKNFRNFQLSEI
jgi:hypothetical protein